MHTAQSRNLKQAFKATQREQGKDRTVPFQYFLLLNKNHNILNISIRLKYQHEYQSPSEWLPSYSRGRLLMWHCPDHHVHYFLQFRRNRSLKEFESVQSVIFRFLRHLSFLFFYLSFLVPVTPMKSVSNTRQGDRQGGWGWREEYMGERKNFRREIVFWDPQCVKNSNPLCEVIPDICLHF